MALPKNQPKTSSQHPRSPKHISGALRCAPSELWLDLSSPSFPLITWQEGNTSLGMGCCCFCSEMHSWSSLWDQGETVSHRSRPIEEREGFSLTCCWRTLKWQSFSEVLVVFPSWGAACNPIQQSARDNFTCVFSTHRARHSMQTYTPLPHSLEAIQSNCKAVYQYRESRW